MELTDEINKRRTFGIISHPDAVKDLVSDVFFERQTPEILAIA